MASVLRVPLIDAVREHVKSTIKIHAGDTLVPVLAPGTGKTESGRLWTCVRDHRSPGDPTVPAVWFALAYAPDLRDTSVRQPEPVDGNNAPPVGYLRCRRSARARGRRQS